MATMAPHHAYENPPGAQESATERLLEALERIADENRSRAGILWASNEYGESWQDAMDAVYAGSDLGDNRVIERIQQMYFEASEPQGEPDESPLLAAFIDEMGVDEQALMEAIEERLNDTRGYRQ